jgi:hypothetical protein
MTSFHHFSFGCAIRNILACNTPLNEPARIAISHILFDYANNLRSRGRIESVPRFEIYLRKAKQQPNKRKRKAKSYKES